MVRPSVRLSGEQLSGWTPRARSEPRYDIVLDPDVAIRLPDGTILRGDLYRPQAEGAFPALVAWSPYTKELQTTGLPMPINEVGVVSYIVSRGYCHLTVNARGTGKSGGERAMQFTPQEQKDVADTIEWVGSQPWCDGNVGMVGMSYFAVIQYLAAAQQPAHLKAIFPYLGFTDLYRHFVYHGGAFHADFFASYFSLVAGTQHASVPPRVRHAMSYVFNREGPQSLGRRIFWRMRKRVHRRAHPGESWIRDFVTLGFDEANDGPFYHEKSAWPVLDRIQVPVCIGTNWGNPGLHMRGAFQAWAAIQAPKQLFIGPPDSRWPWANYQDELLAWYDHYLKGIDTGVQDLAPVRYWLLGANRWRTASAWPIPNTTRQRYYLTTGHPDGQDHYALQTEPPDATTTTSFLAVPRSMPYPKSLEQYQAQVVRYVTPPFDAATEMTGPISLHLTLSSTALDTHVVARVSDLAPTGATRPLSFGWLQASHRAADQDLSRPDEIIHAHRCPEPLSPGQPVRLEFSLTPTANLFQRGHRLLLEIGSRPDLFETRPEDLFVYFAYEAPPYPARNTLIHGGEQPPYLQVEMRTD